MDLTPEYILQCEKAKEIQNNDYDDFTYSYCTKHKVLRQLDYDGVWICPKATEKENYKCNVIFLPRQDHLQKMYFDFRKEKFESALTGEEYIELPSVRLVANSLEHLKYFNDTQRKSGRMFSSYEQLWFAFVMDELYQKRWAGKGWIKK